MSNNSFHFDVSERKVLLRIFDIGSVLFLLHFVGNIINLDYFIISARHWFWSIVLAFYLTVFGTIFELYNLQKASNFVIVFKNVLITSSITVLFYLFTPYFTPSLPSNRLQIIYFFLAMTVALLVWRYAYIVFISTPKFYKKVLLVAPGGQVDGIVASLQKSDPNYKVVNYFDISEQECAVYNSQGIQALNFVDFSLMAEDSAISEIIVCTFASEGIPMQLNSRLVKLLEKGKVVRDYAQVYEELTQRIHIQQVSGDFYRYFPFGRNNRNKLYLFLSEVMDLVLCILGLGFGIVLLPFLLIGNAIGNRGSLMFTQTRVGRNGKHFRLYKLRSMGKNAEANGFQFAVSGDIRATKFGRFLRKSRLDEVPQFLNVLKGEMSVIGPRPERPEFVEELVENLPFYEVRHLVRPGITGWAQVNAKYGSSQEDSLEKLQYDFYYIKHRSLFLDMEIIIKTLSTIIFFRGQ